MKLGVLCLDGIYLPISRKRGATLEGALGPGSVLDKREEIIEVGDALVQVDLIRSYP